MSARDARFMLDKRAPLPLRHWQYAVLHALACLEDCLSRPSCPLPAALQEYRRQSVSRPDSAYVFGRDLPDMDCADRLTRTHEIAHESSQELALQGLLRMSIAETPGRGVRTPKTEGAWSLLASASATPVRIRKSGDDIREDELTGVETVPSSRTSQFETQICTEGRDGLT